MPETMISRIPKVQNLDASSSASPKQAHAKNRLMASLVTERSLAFMQGIQGPTVLLLDGSSMMQGALQSRDGIRIAPEGCLLNLSGDLLIRASMFGSVPPNPKPAQLGYNAYCERLGVEMHLFPALVDGYGRIAENERAVDGALRDSILAAADDPGCDSIVVMGADGGFSRAATYAKRKGKNVFVVAWSGTLHPALAVAATDHITIEELRHFIARVVH